jgi:outer membrane immunogenic protein
MNWKLLLQGVLLLAAMPAIAADLGAPPVEPLPPAAPIAVPFNWSGFYVGAVVGYQWDKMDGTYFNPVFTAPTIKADGDGFVGGAYAGYNAQLGQFVVGLEADVEAVGASGYGEDRILNAYFDIDQKWQGSARARLGYAIDRFMPYLTGGVSLAKWDIEGGTVIAPTTSFTYSTTQVGWTAGAGIEYAFTDNLIGRAEYRYADYGEESKAIPIPPDFDRVDLKSHTARVGVGYKF